MAAPPESVTPPRFKSNDLSRDERLQIQTLRQVGWTLDQIATQMGFTWRQVQHACASSNITPKKRTGRPPLLSTSQVEELIAFVCTSAATRRMAYSRIPLALNWDVLEYAIRYALWQAGFKRYTALRKPPIIEKHRVDRLEKALERVNWPVERLYEILWSDETWVAGGPHRKVYVTRRQHEALDPTCIVERIQRRRGWMFWGSYSVKYGKGPYLFWEKEWGAITAEKYSEKVIPLVDAWFRMYPWQVFMHDNASPHAASLTREEIIERGILLYDHPPFSPDLNPIEDAWNWMKDYIERHFPAKMSYDQLRIAVKEAWEALPEDFLKARVDSMIERWQAVIDANGMHIPF